MEISETKSYNLKDKKVIDGLYREYWKILYAISYKSTKDSVASEELVQDVFIALWKRGGKLKIEYSIKSYLIKALKNGILKYHQKCQQTKIVPLETTKSEEEINYSDQAVENKAIEKLLHEDVELVVAHLPHQSQKVFRLSREQFKTIPEISSILDISPNTVKNHLVKALQIIRKSAESSFKT